MPKKVIHGQSSHIAGIDLIVLDRSDIGGSKVPFEQGKTILYVTPSTPHQKDIQELLHSEVDSGPGK